MKKVHLKLIIGNQEKTISLLNLYQLFLQHARELEKQHMNSFYDGL